MLIAVDKEKGITSFDLIRKLKPKFPKKTKIGHSGTLDPMASGLMLIGIYKEGTKLLNNLQGLNKTYETIIDFSKMSDTRDMDYWDYYEEYQITIKNKKKGLFLPYNSHKNTNQVSNNTYNFIPSPEIKEIEKFLNKLIPKYEIPLTPFSAKKINGQRMYELARKGKSIIKNKVMIINGYKIIDYKFPLLKVKFDVGSGTYIRSLGYRLGQQLGLGGILTYLRRLSIGDYNLENIKYNEDLGLKYKIIIK